MAFDLRPLGTLIKRSLRFLQRRTPDGTTTRRAAGSGMRPYPGDFQGSASIRYSPRPDGKPDPGEIVWSWVPYEEDHSRGKDRPVLLVGHDGGWLLGLMLTSKDHGNGNGSGDYVDIGAGPWDRSRRPSEVRIDRIIRLHPADIRREGAVLDSAGFQSVSQALRGRRGWK